VPPATRRRSRSTAPAPTVAQQAAAAKSQLDAQADVLARQMASKVLGREVAS